ncbi:MAG: hypothetical protein ACXWM7_06910 [Parachlamydiaceae bacterium]
MEKPRSSGQICLTNIIPRNQNYNRKFSYKGMDLLAQVDTFTFKDTTSFLLEIAQLEGPSNWDRFFFSGEGGGGERFDEIAGSI